MRFLTILFVAVAVSYASDITILLQTSLADGGSPRIHISVTNDSLMLMATYTRRQGRKDSEMGVLYCTRLVPGEYMQYRYFAPWFKGPLKIVGKLIAGVYFSEIKLVPRNMDLIESSKRYFANK